MSNHDLVAPSRGKGVFMFCILIFAYIIFAINWVAGSNLSKEITTHYFNGQAVSPMVSEIVNYTITAARIVANLLAVFVLLKLHPKKATLVALILLSFSFIAVFSSNYWLYTGARMIMALGGSMIMVFINVYVAKFIPRDSKLIAGSFITAAYNIGAALVAILFLLFSEFLRSDWQNTMTIFSGVTLFLVVLWYFVAEDFESIPHSASNKNYFYQKLLHESREAVHFEEEKEYTYGDALKERFVYYFSIGFGGFIFLYVMSLVSLPNQVAQNVTTGFKAPFMILFITLGGILGTVIDLFILKYIVRKKLYLLINGTGMIVTMALAIYFAASNVNIAYGLFFLSGLFMYFQYPVYLNYPYDLPGVTPKRLVIVFGIMWAVAYGLHTIFNVVWSLILQSQGYVAAMIFYFVMSSIYLIFVALFPTPKKK